MKNTLFKIRNSLGLAFRIILAVLIAGVIIWKFRDLQNIDVRAILDSAATLPMKLASVLGIYAVKGLTLVVPASLVYIAIGMALSPLWLALLINVVGIALEVSITYLMGIILGGPFVTKKIEKTKYGKKLISIYEKYEKKGIFLIRLAGLPIDFCSLFFGAMRTEFLPYLGLSLAGILPRVILFTILGDKVYNLIPMKYVIPVAAVLILAALIVWIVKYAIGITKKEREFGKPAYTPISELKRNVILDTDMGPDCDDAGALAILHGYLSKYGVNLLGVCNCTSNPYANGAIRAICSYYGTEEPFVGKYSGGVMLPDGLRYNKEVTNTYCKYESSACHGIPETEFYTNLLSSAEDNSVTIITIGTFSSVAAALRENPELFNRKVHSIVSMAGEYPKGKEFNIKSDPLSAACVLEKFKNIIVFSGHEVGIRIKTGFDAPQYGNPVYDAYRLYVGGDNPPYLRESWDLTAVQYAFEGNGSFYALSKPMNVTIDTDGNMTAKHNKFANRYFIQRIDENDNLEDYLNSLLRQGPYTAKHEKEETVI